MKQHNSKYLTGQRRNQEGHERYFELKEEVNTTDQNLEDAVEALLRALWVLKMCQKRRNF